MFQMKLSFLFRYLIGCVYAVCVCVCVCVCCMEKQRLGLEGVYAWRIHSTSFNSCFIFLFIWFWGEFSIFFGFKKWYLKEEWKCLFFRVKKKKNKNLSKYAFCSTWSWKSFASEMSFISSLWWNFPTSPDRHSSTCALHKLGGRVLLSYLTI